MREYAAGHLGGAGFATCAPTVMGNKPRATAPFLTQPDIAHVPPLQVGKGDSSDGLEVPCDAFVYGVYSSVTLPHPQNELPCVAKCSVPVPVQPSITDVIFLQLAPVAEVLPLRLDQFKLEFQEFAKDFG